jgi:hypothetical protein
MLCRTCWALMLTFPLLGVGSGCDNRPKIVMPKEKAPPAPRPRVAGPGSAPAEPSTPGLDPNQKTNKVPPAPRPHVVGGGAPADPGGPN